MRLAIVPYHRLICWLTLLIYPLALCSQRSLELSLGTGVQNYGLVATRPTEVVDSRSEIKQNLVFDAMLTLQLWKRGRNSVNVLAGYSLGISGSSIAGLRFPSDLGVSPPTESLANNRIVANFLMFGIEGRYDLFSGSKRELSVGIKAGGGTPISIDSQAEINFGNGSTENTDNANPEFKDVIPFLSIGGYYFHHFSQQYSFFVGPSAMFYLGGLGETFFGQHRISLTSFNLSIGVSKTL